MSTITLTRRQAIAALMGAATLASPARAGLIVGSNGPLIGRAPGPVVSLDRPRRATKPSAPDQASIPAAQPKSSETLAIPLSNANTGDRMTAVFATDGPKVAALEKPELDWFFRDWRQNETRPMDPQILAILVGLVRKARAEGWDGQVRVTSGYRSRETNDQLRRRGLGAAHNSLHIQAKAIDFSFPGLDMAVLHRMAREQARGGVGLYQSFVHIDSGPRRNWAG